MAQVTVTFGCSVPPGGIESVVKVPSRRAELAELLGAGARAEEPEAAGAHGREAAVGVDPAEALAVEPADLDAIDVVVARGSVSR